jgi:hypothetical protein
MFFGSHCPCRGDQGMIEEKKKRTNVWAKGKEPKEIIINTKSAFCFRSLTVFLRRLATRMKIQKTSHQIFSLHFQRSLLCGSYRWQNDSFSHRKLIWGLIRDSFSGNIFLFSIFQLNYVQHL